MGLEVLNFAKNEVFVFIGGGSQFICTPFLEYKNTYGFPAFC